MASQTDIGSPDFKRTIPDGDERERLVCRRCSFIHYDNPKIVVGAVITDPEDRIVLCRRAIEPQRGLWTIPAGFMELGETPEGGAIREAMEEACAHIRICDMLALYTLPHISQVQIMYRATLIDPDISPGLESLDVMKVSWNDIPWDELAFPSVLWSLRHFDQVRDQKHFAPFGNPD